MEQKSQQYHQDADIKEKIDNLNYIIDFYKKSDMIKDRRIAESEEREKKAQAQKRIDELTQCPNLSVLTEWIENNQKPEKLNQVGIIYIDINGLKFVNDTFTHEAGDKLIVKTAELLKLVFKEDGTVFRKYRGDEFVIGCHNSANHENYEEYLISKVKEAQLLANDTFFRFKNNSTNIESFIPLSFAGGVAVFDGKPHYDNNKVDDTLYDTDERADNAMYEDKRASKIKDQQP